MFFSIFWTKLFRSRSQKFLNAGAGIKKFRCPDLERETEIWVPAPQPWRWQRLFWVNARFTTSQQGLFWQVKALLTCLTSVTGQSTCTHNTCRQKASFNHYSNVEMCYRLVHHDSTKALQVVHLRTPAPQAGHSIGNVALIRARHFT